MPVPEPPSDLGLWPAVKALSSWPETDEDAVRALGDGWQQAAAGFEAAAGYDVGSVLGSWADTAGVAMVDRTGQALIAAQQSARSMQQLAGQASHFADAVTQTKTAVSNLIRDNLGRYAALMALPSGTAEAFQTSFVNELANAVNTYTAQMAAKVAADSSTLAAGLTPAAVTAPPPGASPDQVKAWWDSLTDEQRATVLRDSPDQIGNLDGIPATIRDAANRSMLDQQLAALQAERGALAQKLETQNKTPAGPLYTDILELRELDEKIAGVGQIQQRLAEAPAGQPPAFLLGLDPTGDGQAIVAIGNPDTAGNVATMVPGTTARLGTFGGEMARADLLWQSAQRAGSPSTSVVAWLGYDAPDEIPNASSASYADGAVKPLQDFQNGLRSTHEGPRSLNTVVGHSYGTTAIGHAAVKGSLDADQIEFVASPGVLAETVTDLHLDGVPAADVGRRVFSTVSATDPINVTNLPGVDALGPDPAGPSFGGRTFESPRGGDLHIPVEGGGEFVIPQLENHWHSSYFEGSLDPAQPRNPTLDETGQIIAGNRR
ncbi:hypothetical protein BWI15_28505 [Kribbella sp. ALI-6-A]|uniref:WXG100-like domain-containing protein n=1 Tax=Kribbella sp. ALI-6-A TaxID=1933817 RepID=UPI0009C8EA1B|nr:alpha/beta hydrolase [Kribbella sp. ALI-6-A]ONI67112.1 hypothetical protein BWI15_28505 [Kribbella sp. ALI-6-A]